MKRFFCSVAVVSLALLLPVVVAQALPVWLPGSTVVATAGPQGSPMNITAMMLQNATLSSGGTITETADTIEFDNGTMTQMGWEWTWTSILLDRDPIVSSVGGFKNLGATQDFVFSTVTPISPALATTHYGGSTNLTYVDANGDTLGGLSNDAGGNPAYSGTIDGTGQLSMLTTLNITTSGTNASEFQGLPGPTIPGPAANSTIGIVHRFELSAGDQMTYSSTFQVVPEPGTIALFAAGLAGLAAFGRRSRT